jgi:hypothetical protein
MKQDLQGRMFLFSSTWDYVHKKHAVLRTLHFFLCWSLSTKGRPLQDWNFVHYEPWQPSLNISPPNVWDPQYIAFDTVCCGVSNIYWACFGRKFITQKTVLSFKSWWYVLGTQGDKEHVVGMYIQVFCSSALCIRRLSRVSSAHIQAVPGSYLGPETGYLDGNFRVFSPQSAHVDARMS